MPDYLALTDWTKELKKYDDAKDVRPVERLLKELSQRQNEDDAAGQRQALAALAEVASGAKKKNAKLQELADYLDEVAKAAEKELKQLEAKGGSDDSDDDDDEGAALAVLIPRVRKRSPEKAYNFVLAIGKPSGLVITKKTLTASHTKDAKDMREGQGKIVEGRCFGDGAFHVFEIVEAPPRGMAKKLKQTVFAKSELKIKVKVRGGGVELDDETDVDDDEGQTAPAAAPSMGSVAYAKLLLAFDGAKKKLHGELASLERAILEEFAGDDELAEVKEDVRQLDQILQTFDDSLKDLFDDAINVPAGERGRFHTQAVAVIDRYQSYLASDPFVRDIADNPFGVPVSIKVMSDTLTLMANKLA